MQIGYKKEEFLPLLALIDRAKDGARVKANEIKAMLDRRNEAMNNNWFARVFGTGRDYVAFGLSMDLCEQNNKVAMLSRAALSIQLAMKSKAEQVIVSHEEARLIEIYTRD